MSAAFWRPDQAYNDLPPIPPSPQLETRAVLKRCIGARAALAELKQAARLIPNQAMLVNTLPMLEAQSSSEIENIVTTADRLFRFAQDDGTADPATKEALRYRQALMEGTKALDRRPLGTATAEAVCTMIRGTETMVRRVPGTALARATTREIVYTPPEGEAKIRDLLADWERFLHTRRDVDPLIRMAAAHYQFEAVHPFVDGNGRTGRVLNSLFLIEAGLLDIPVLYLSRFIIRRKEDYYQLLLDVTRSGAWEPWLLYLLEGIEETSAWTTDKIAAIRSLVDQTVTHVRERLPKVYRRELVDLLFEQPYCRIANLVDAGVAKRQAASRYLHELVGIGVLEVQEIGRDKLFTHPKLLTLLTGDRNDVVGYG